MVTSLQSYVQDTRYVSKKAQDLEIPEEALLVGVGVESLNTSIPHKWGLKVIAHLLWNLHADMGAQNEFLMELMEFVLMHNFFQFMGSYYHQNKGTSMGAPWGISASGTTGGANSLSLSNVLCPSVGLGMPH